jgi:hypothetical protein
LQTFDEIKLYVAPKNYKQTSTTTNATAITAPSSNDEQQSDTKIDNTTSSPAHQSPITNISYPNSTKLPRRNESMRNASANTANNSAANESQDASEVDLKEILNQICETISNTQLSEWFRFSSNQRQQDDAVPVTRPDSPLSVGDFLPPPPPPPRIQLFDSILQALNHIDFNLKRNSDFINELTKLLDTSRVIKQEAQLKKGK